MRALSLRQPWATLIAIGRKTVETRDWWPPRILIGRRLAIHAAKRPLPREADIPRGCEDMPFGALVCHARVARVERLLGDWDDRRRACCECAGKVGIFLDGVVRLDPPIPWKGHQGIFRVPDAHIPAFCERCLRPLSGWFVRENPELAPCRCGRLCCDRCLVPCNSASSPICRTCLGKGAPR